MGGGGQERRGGPPPGRRGRRGAAGARNHGRAPCGGGLPVHKVHGHRTLPPAGAGRGDRPRVPEAMVEALNLDLEKVQTDLLTYKNILSKMAKGKELMEEVLQRERKKTAERLAEKAKAEAEAAGDAAP